MFQQIKATAIFLIVIVSSFLFNGFSFAANEIDHSSDAITFEQLQTLVIKNKIGTIDSFLELLSNHPLTASLFSNFTLHPNPQGGQKGTPLNPRAILFSKDLLMTFTGDPNVAGGDAIEMIFFTKEKEFEFRNIQFPSEKNRLDAVRFSPKNPTQCFGCHKGRPNWERYREWNHMYGQADDAITLRVSQFAHDKFTGDPVEYNNFMRYLQESSNKGLYKYLRPPEGSPVSPYAPDKEFPDFRFRPNLRLGELINHMNAERVFHRLKKNANYEKLRAALLIAGDTSKLLTESDRQTLAQEFKTGTDIWDPESAILKGKSIWSKYMQAFFAVLKEISLDPHDTSLQFNQRILKLSPQEISTLYSQPETKSWDYYDGGRTFSNRLQLLLEEELYRERPEMKNVNQYHPEYVQSLMVEVRRPWATNRCAEIFF
ncbi:MAG: hypothetical protein ACXVB4_18255 [Pseudobdellovibrionaceae bacterium]